MTIFKNYLERLIQTNTEADAATDVIADSRLVLYGTSIVGGNVVLAIQDQVGTDLSLSNDGTTITFNTEGIYTINYAVDGGAGSVGGPLADDWSFNWQIDGTIYGVVATATGCVINRLAIGDTTKLTVSGTATGGSMNIIRLA
jgi:hypothetical protein